MRKSFREEVAFELDLKGCLDLDMYGFTDESTVGADMAVRNLSVYGEQWTLILGWCIFAILSIWFSTKARGMFT